MIDLQIDIPVVAVENGVQPLQYLVSQIKAQPVYAQFMDAYRALQADNTAQGLLSELRAQQYQGHNQANYDRLLQQFYAQPTIKTYQEAEEMMQDLLKAVDAIISDAIGIEFAANAKQSCCGG